MRCGDTVKHGPSGETWTVAYVDGGHLAWIGWPFGEAAVSDCTLLSTCSDETHIALLKTIEGSRGEGSDRRSRMARTELERFALTLTEPATKRDNLDKLIADVADAAVELHRNYGLWTAAGERFQRLDALKRAAYRELIDAHFPDRASA